MLLGLKACGVEEPDGLGRSQNGGRVSTLLIIDKVVMAFTVVVCGAAAGFLGGREGQIETMAQAGALLANVLGLLIPGQRIVKSST